MQRSAIKGKLSYFRVLDSNGMFLWATTATSYSGADAKLREAMPELSEGLYSITRIQNKY